MILMVACSGIYDEKGRYRKGSYIENGIRSTMGSISQKTPI